MIRKLLVANRGEIAARIIRSAHDADIACVAVCSDADADAPYVADADEVVRLPGNDLASTYLDGAALVDAARRTGADAVHPGYGFLSENAGFARACAAAGLTFVGPPPEAIEAMGSKIAAKETMAAAGVPVLPGVTVTGDDATARIAETVGFPALVKAAFGGGGRGMRIVRDAGDLADAVAAAQREAASAFGDGTVFVERYVQRPRHIEVQIFGDTAGTVVHLFERECSIQRRYQKIIEEAPSPAVDEALRAELGRAAVAAGTAIGYVGAGTVEFVLGADGAFHFLEVNTRLQVEHPVTELVTGLDLVRLQLDVADGKPLPPQVRAATVTGHAIEARLYAEDVPAGFLPATGTVHAFEVPGEVRVDAGVRAGSRVSPHYDAMLAKVIAYGADRDTARRRLARALAGARLHGVVTNRDLLTGILRDPEFAAGHIDTGYLTRHEPVSLMARDPLVGTLHPLAAALAGQAERRAAATALRTLPSGWRNVADAPQHTEFTVDGAPVDVRYRLDGESVTAWVGGEQVTATVRAVLPTRVELETGGVLRTFHIGHYGAEFWVDSPLGSTAAVEQPRFADPAAAIAAGSLVAPMPGTVLRIAVEVGDTVAAGATVLVLEAMKMEHTVTAPAAGVLSEVGVRAGQAVETGTVLAVLEEKVMNTGENA